MPLKIRLDHLVLFSCSMTIFWYSTTTLLGAFPSVGPCHFLIPNREYGLCTTRKMWVLVICVCSAGGRALPWLGTPWNASPPRPPLQWLWHLPPSPWLCELSLQDLAPWPYFDVSDWRRRGVQGWQTKKKKEGENNTRRKKGKKTTFQSSKHWLVAPNSSQQNSI